MEHVRRAARIAHILIVASTVLATIALVVLAAGLPFILVYLIEGNDRAFYWLATTIIVAPLTFAGWIYLLVSAAFSD